MSPFSFEQPLFFHPDDGQKFVAMTKKIWRYICDLWIWKFIWNLVCGLSSLIFLPSQEHEQVEQARIKALQYRGMYY